MFGGDLIRCPIKYFTCKSHWYNKVDIHLMRTTRSWNKYNVEITGTIIIVIML